jgi:hypothetical protein
MGFTMIPGTKVPFDYIGVMSPEVQTAWTRSRYCDWNVLEQTPGSHEWDSAREEAKKAREAFEYVLDVADVAVGLTALGNVENVGSVSNF